MEWDANIKKYLIERLNPRYKLTLCLEYFEFTLNQWLTDDPERISLYLDQMIKVCNFLKENQIIHFDAHIHNILTDGKTMYLTDFGLVLDKQYLSEEKELDFFEKNRYIDYAHVIANIYEYLFNKIFDQNLESIGIKEGHMRDTMESNLKIIFDNLEKLTKYFNCNPGYYVSLKKFQNIAFLFNSFMYKLRFNEKKDNVFPNEEIKKLLKQIYK